jgi:hypothetical protein
MKSMKWFSLAALCVGGAIVFFTACQKSASNSNSSVPAGQQKFQMYLTDGPVNFQEVNIDIKSIMVFLKTDSCSTNGMGQDSTAPCYHWDTLNITPGVYNILDFQNGIDTLFSSTNIEAGKILKIRVVLGDNNTVMADSTLFHLALLWGDTFDIVVDDCQQIDANTLALWVDFDAAHSIIEVSHQQFALRPYIRLFTKQNSGTLEGAVLPGAADAFVSCVSGSDTLIALPGHDGRYEIRGIKTPTVNVTFYGTGNGYGDTTINNVSIIPGTITNLGTVYLH